MFKAFVFGRLTKDPTVNKAASGTMYTRFSVAVNVGKREDDKVTFIDVSAFGRQGELIAQSCKKGQRILVELSDLEVDAWTSRQGDPMGSLNAVLTSFSFVESRDEGQSVPQGAQPPTQGYAQPPTQGAQPPTQGAQPPTQGYAQPPTQGYAQPPTQGGGRAPW